MPDKEFSKFLSRRDFLKTGMGLLIGLGLPSCKVSEKNNFEDYNQELKLKAESEFQNSYIDWKNKYAVIQGETAKVVRPEQGNDEVSEGIGYGLILAVHAQDMDLFNKFWNEAKTHFNQNGLMSWRINTDGNVPDSDSATDADLDMAYALLVAGKNDEATGLINTILEHEVEKDTFVLKPGDGWGGSSATAPSYFSPAYFDIFSRVTNNPNWNNVAAKCREIIDKVQQKMGGLETGLVPDWCTVEGEAVPDQNNTYSYNACRFPWRQAMVFGMGITDSLVITHANAQMNKINNFILNTEPSKIVDGYKINGEPVGIYHNNAFVGTFAAASWNSSNLDFQKMMFEELVKTQPDSYFSHSLRCLSFLLLSGKMKSV